MSVVLKLTEDVHLSTSKVFDVSTVSTSFEIAMATAF